MLRKIISRIRGVRQQPCQWQVPNPKDTDIHLVSYPKSGNTWMRYLLAYAIWPEIDDPDLRDMAGLIPSFGLEYDYRMMLDCKAPCNRIKHRIIKQHFPYGDEAKSLVNKAIYLCRDGRDAIVSYWHFCNQRDGTKIPFKEFVRVSALPEHSYGPWRAHVLGWLHAPIEKIIVRYEDLLNNPKKELTKVLSFIEIERTEEEIVNAINRASFDRMKRLENSRGLNLEQLKNVNFVRRGGVGGWKEEFVDSEVIELFNRYHGGVIPELGYIWE